MKTKPLTQPTAYRAYILAPQKDGSVDLIDPTTGRWIRSSTPRYAKWRATFLTNIHTAMASSQPVPVPTIPNTQN